MHCWSKQRDRAIPRLSDQAGVWFANQNPELRKVFTGTPFEGERWRHEMVRLDEARRSDKTIRIGGYAGKAIWLPRTALPDEEDTENIGRPL
jgi:hypothetical protein